MTPGGHTDPPLQYDDIFLIKHFVFYMPATRRGDLYVCPVYQDESAFNMINHNY